MRRTLTVIVTLVASTVLLAGCGDENDPAKSPGTTTTPSASATPTVSPEEEAEAAAWEAYLRYERVRTDLKRSPDPKAANRKVALVAVPPESAYVVVQIADYEAKGRRLTGGELVPTKTGSNVRSLDEVVFDVCVDSSAIDIVDKTGKSVVSADRPKSTSATMTVKKVKGTWYVAKVDGGTEAC